MLSLSTAFVLLGGVSKGYGSHRSGTAAKPSGVYWGAYVAGGQYRRTDAPWDLTALCQFETNTGKHVSLLEWGQAWYECSTTCGLRPFRADLMERVRRHGAIPVLSWDSKHAGSGASDPEFSLHAIIAGRYDSFIRDWARGAKRWGHPFFLRFDWEMNTNGVPYSEHSNGNRRGEFVQMWRHVRRIFTQVRVRNATWVWCPNVEYEGSVQPLRSLYPGDRYVDWTCLDGYNWGTNPSDPQGWRSFDKTFGPTYALLTRKLAPSMPLMIGETGSSEFGGSKPAWITDALTRQLPGKDRRVKALVWFNKNWDGMEWIIESSLAAQAALPAPSAHTATPRTASAGWPLRRSRRCGRSGAAFLGCTRRSKSESKIARRSRSLRAMTVDARGSLVRVVSPAPRDAWASILKASAEHTIFHTPEWLDACCSASGFEDASRLYETDGGKQIILPMVRRPGPRRALRTAWSMPDGWGFGGAIGSGRVVPEDVAIVLEDLLGASARLIMKPGPLTCDAWISAPAQERLPHFAHFVDLREGFGALWSDRFSSGTRNKIRKAQKEGVEVQWGTGGDLMKVHWGIYLRWTIRRAKERGIPVPVALAVAKRRESLARFETIARCLGDRCQVGIAWIDGRPAASAVVLSNGAHVHYWRSASDQALVGRRYANYLLLSRALEDAAERGYRYVDMGESGGIRSLIEFKEHFGAKPVSHEELRFEPRIVTNTMRVRDRLLRGASDLTLKAAARLKHLGVRTN